MKHLGDRIREARKEKGLTQKALAIACNTDEAVIRGYEKGRIAPSKKMMVSIMEALEVYPDYLYQDELSFNPYEDKDRLFSDIAKLSPKNYNLVKMFVHNLMEE
jgi:transcriptional regulator with XRE-family HTH domain